MVNIELLADNLPLILTEIVKIKEVVKYLSYDVKNPLSQPDIALPATGLLMTKVFPYPFLSTSVTSDCSQIRVFYPEGIFESNGEIACTSLFFDIVVAKELWLVNDGKSSVRPYMIMSHLVKHFNAKSIGTIGRLEFVKFEHLNVDESFDVIRVQAEMTVFGGVSND